MEGEFNLEEKPHSSRSQYRSHDLQVLLDDDPTQSLLKLSEKIVDH